MPLSYARRLPVWFALGYLLPLAPHLWWSQRFLSSECRDGHLAELGVRSAPTVQAARAPGL